ncbi:uncharacterized protein LOC110391076 [Numida meleagris]|uniref:uncharacterized protein LOC110391076 n=1 Tax=Numida meleagris TaxID=8996 RepID=UPI000B3DE38D|nr:uncharacterized protein LOC110391076 [Numida meleagris]
MTSQLNGRCTNTNFYAHHNHLGGTERRENLFRFPTLDLILIEAVRDVKLRLPRGEIRELTNYSFLELLPPPLRTGECCSSKKPTRPMSKEITSHSSAQSHRFSEAEERGQRCPSEAHIAQRPVHKEKPIGRPLSCRAHARRAASPRLSIATSPLPPTPTPPTRTSYTEAHRAPPPDAPRPREAGRTGRSPAARLGSTGLRAQLGTERRESPDVAAAAATRQDQDFDTPLQELFKKCLEKVHGIGLRNLSSIGSSLIMPIAFSKNSETIQREEVCDCTSY